VHALEPLGYTVTLKWIRDHYHPSYDAAFATDPDGKQHRGGSP
jgi:hypothetical protein